MKLAHIADPHLGVRQYHRQTNAGINQREADVANAFRAAVNGVIAARPDAVIVAGDLFHSVRPTNAAIVFAFREFQRLREALPAAPIVLIAGNHDTPRSSETGSILRLFAELGVDVATDDARRLVYPPLELSVLAVPHAALVGEERPVLRPEGGARRQVLVVHGEVEGVIPGNRAALEYGGAPLTRAELGLDEWSYVALGHYHVRHQVASRAWYAGALDYVSSNLWGELADEADLGVNGKGWLLVDVDSGAAQVHTVPAARRVLDLDPVHGKGLDAAAIDAEIERRLAAVPGGITDQILRLRVFDVPRHVARSLDHAAIRAWKSNALHLNLDIRRPELQRTVGIGAPGRRQTLPELVRDYLERRPLPAEIDRAAFVRSGGELIDSVERDATAAG
ncbi:MAG TPA: exonuclease SbcCD subunit D [Gemmatimonadales bacterium]|nr:exonuclease SbcCD subunit D [Gemmatimonadales bacterium]